MGRHRKSIEEHKANGTYKPSKHDLPVIMKEVINPKPYIQLDEWSEKFFYGICDDMREANKLAPEDLVLITNLAKLAGVVKEADDILKEEGMFSDGYNKNKVPHPAWTIMKGAMTEMGKVAKELGIGPMVRLRLALNNKTLNKKPDEKKGVNLD